MRPGPLLLRVALLFGLGVSPALADKLWTWESLRVPRKKGGGMFSRWGVDQQRILRRLRAVERSDAVRAVADLTRRLRAKPQDLALRDQLGFACLRAGRIAEAVEQFRAVLRADPAFARSRLHLADLFEGMGRGEPAARELAELVRLKPELVRPRERLAALYSRLGRHKAAASMYRELARREPDQASRLADLGRALLRSGQLDAAKAVADQALDHAPDAPDTRLLLAHYHRVQGEWEAAKAHLQFLATHDPESDATRQLGFLYLRQRRFHEARDAFRLAIGTRGPRESTLAGAAVAAQGARAFDDAAKLCRQLRDLPSRGDRTLAERRHRTACLLLASLWLAKGDKPGMRAACEGLHHGAGAVARGYAALFAATQGRPDARRDTALLVSLARVFLRLRWTAAAIEAAQAAWEKSPKNLVVGQTLARAYRAAGRHADELRLREQLATEHPDDPTSAIALAHTATRLGRFAQAAAACRAILPGLDARLARLRTQAGLAVQQGKRAAAARHRRASLDPLHSKLTALAILAELAMRRGDYEAAAQHYRAAVESRPKAPAEPGKATVQALDAASARMLGRARGRLLEALVAAGKAGEAAELVRRQPEEDPLFIPLPVHRAVRALASAKLDDALAACRTGLRHDPLDAALRLLAGIVLARKGEPRDAAGQFQIHYWADRSHLPGPLLLAQPGVRDVHTRLVSAYLAHGDGDRAGAIAEAVLLTPPEDAQTRRRVLTTFRKAGDLAGAIRLWQQIAKARPSPLLDARLGILHLIGGKPREAAERLAAAAGRLPRTDRAGALRWQAAALFSFGDDDKAQTSMQRSLAIAPHGAPPSFTFAAFLNALGLAAAARRNLAPIEQAAPQLAEWARAALPRVRANRELVAAVVAAHAAQQTKWPRQALELLIRARELAPREPAVLHALCTACRKAGKIEMAPKFARELVACAPESALAHLTLAKALEEAGEPELAIGAYQAALRLQPGNAPAANNLAWLYARHKPDQLAEAQRLAERAVKQQPGNASFRDTLGWICFLRNDYDRAVASLEKAQAIDPKHAASHYHLGVVHFKRDRPALAREALRRFVSLAPRHPDAEEARRILRLLEAKKAPSSPAPKRPG